MADEKPAPKKRTRRRGFPWTPCANAIKALGRDDKESEQLAWNLWFETACPQAHALIKDDEGALRELYEQLSGKLVDDEEEESDKAEDETK